MPSVTVVADGPSKSADDILSGREWERVKQLGKKVYSKHPIGFGDAGLLTAYHFQCPNNTIPIVWADGRNNDVNGNSYPWNPLFRYIPKAKSRNKDSKTKSESTKHLDLESELAGASWVWSDVEKNESCLSA